MYKLETKYRLVRSIKKFKAIKYGENREKKVNAENELRDNFDGAMEKLVKNNDNLTKITKPQIQLIMFVIHHEFIKETNSMNKV